MKPPASSNQIEAPVLDNIQLIIQRRAELAKHKAKYALTETDAQLLSTHSVELHFEKDQIIIEQWQDIETVYRIKSGQVAVYHDNLLVNTIGKGWFIGDQLLIYDTPAYTFKKTLKAAGPVVMEKLNLPFIQKLFEVDFVLKARVMRHLVSKFSALSEILLSSVDSCYTKYTHVNTPGEGSPSPSTSSSDLNPETAKILTAGLSNNRDLFSLPNSDSSSSLSSESSLSEHESSPSDASPSDHSSDTASDPSSLSSGPSNSSLSSEYAFNTTPTEERAGVGKRIHSSLQEMKTKERRHSRRETRARAQVAYKSYPLVSTGGGVQVLQLKNKKLTISSKSFGFHFKTTIEYTKIVNLTKVGENAATIIYNPRKVANVFFKNYYEREEFFGLVNSLTNHSPVEPPKPGQSVGVAHNPDLNYDDTPLCQGDGHKYDCNSLQSQSNYKKGDVIFEEGDLFQRIYILNKGYCEIHQGGKQVCTMEEGDIFGVGTILNLRPIPVTLIAGAEVEMMVIPAYKLNAMIDTDAGRAAEIYKDAAIALDRKISQVLGFLPNHKRIAREASQKKEDAESISIATSSVPDVAVN